MQCANAPAFHKSLNPDSWVKSEAFKAQKVQGEAQVNIATRSVLKYGFKKKPHSRCKVFSIIMCSLVTVVTKEQSHFEVQRDMTELAFPVFFSSFL